MERWNLSNRPLRNKHLSCSTQRSLIRVWSHKKCWFCTTQTGMRAGLGLQGHIARKWSQRQSLYVSRTWLLLVNGLAPRTTMENRMQISKIRRKYRCIHTHTHANTLCIFFFQCRSEFETFTFWACRNLDDGVGMWHCAAFSQIQVQHETAWYVQTHIYRMDQRGLSSNCVGAPRSNVQKQHGETIGGRLTMLVATEHVCNSLGSFSWALHVNFICTVDYSSVDKFTIDKHTRDPRPPKQYHINFVPRLAVQNRCL